MSSDDSLERLQELERKLESTQLNRDLHKKRAEAAEHDLKQELKYRSGLEAQVEKWVAAEAQAIHDGISRASEMQGDIQNLEAKLEAAEAPLDTLKNFLEHHGETFHETSRPVGRVIAKVEQLITDLEAAEAKQCHHGWRGASMSQPVRSPRCPACGGQLFIGKGGHLTCSYIGGESSLGCPEPGVERSIQALKVKLVDLDTYSKTLEHNYIAERDKRKAAEDERDAYEAKLAHQESLIKCGGAKAGTDCIRSIGVCRYHLEAKLAERDE